MMSDECGVGSEENGGCAMDLHSSVKRPDITGLKKGEYVLMRVSDKSPPQELSEIALIK